MSILSGLGAIFGTLFSPIGTVFHYVFFEPVYNILILIYHGVGSFALAIVLLTLLIRGALFPLTRRQLSSTRKMQQLQPLLKEIQARNRGNPQAAMAEQQALYKEHGVSMYGGCLPLVIQMPFLYSLFYSFEALLNTANKSAHTALVDANNQIYPFLPRLAALPDTHFLWTNLAQPDPKYILPVLAALLTFVQMRMAMPVRRPGAPVDTTTQTTQSMQWIMPLFTLFLGTRFASGLALYWTVSTGFSAVQQYLLSGWGSLWVGVPGMERFVPAPKDIATATVTGGSANSARSQAGVVRASAVQPPRATGFLASMRDLIQQTREQASSQALVAREQAERSRVVEADEGSGALGGNGAKSAQSAGRDANRDRRPRPPKSGAMLVRPPSDHDAAGQRADEVSGGAPIESAAQLEASATSDLPEKRLARDSAAGMDGIIADTGVRLNGANGAGDTNASSAPKMAAAGASNGSSTGASGGQPRQGTGQRPTGGSGAQRKNQQSRGRNRPRGGR